jgi:hypothetical protein
MKSNKSKFGKAIIIVDPHMPRYGDDPYFKKKTERVKALLMKCDLSILYSSNKKNVNRSK